jgi:hypothetical protein
MLLLGLLRLRRGRSSIRGWRTVRPLNHVGRSITMVYIIRANWVVRNGAWRPYSCIWGMVDGGRRGREIVMPMPTILTLLRRRWRRWKLGLSLSI